MTILQQLKVLSASRDTMQQELVTLREVRDATQEVAGVMEILEGNEDVPFSLAGKLCKVPEAFERYVSVGAYQCHLAMMPANANLGWQYFMNHE